MCVNAAWRTRGRSRSPRRSRPPRSRSPGSRRLSFPSPASTRWPWNLPIQRRTILSTGFSCVVAVVAKRRRQQRRRQQQQRRSQPNKPRRRRRQHAVVPKGGGVPPLPPRPKARTITAYHLGVLSQRLYRGSRHRRRLQQLHLSPARPPARRATPNLQRCRLNRSALSSSSGPAAPKRRSGPPRCSRQKPLTQIPCCAGGWRSQQGRSFCDQQYHQRRRRRTSRSTSDDRAAALLGRQRRRRAALLWQAGRW